MKFTFIIERLLQTRRAVTPWRYSAVNTDTDTDAGYSNSNLDDGDDEDMKVPFIERWRQAARRALKPWHIFAVVAAIAAAVVLAVVLVVARERAKAKAIEDQNTPSNPASARVNLGYAQYQGSFVGTNASVAQYLGIRYAAPPVGDLRFRAPVEMGQRSGDQDANQFGPICLGISVPYPTTGQSEDCLYANVWAPANATLDSKLPVWLFIQGGGYTVNANANWNGTALVERSGGNIVLVNFNYRVGLWGFLASERVRADGDLNAGLLDQRLMMRWVRAHIAQFGGDPGRVVVNGASAGAGSVAMHLLARDEGLFVGAIAESVFFPAQPFVADLEWQFDRVLAERGCGGGGGGDEDPVACLRSRSTAELQSSNVPSPFPGRPDLPAPLFYWTPCIDGELLTDLPYLLFERGQFIDVPILVGTTTNEGTYFADNAATPDEVSVFLQNNYPGLSNSSAADAVQRYPVSGESPAPQHELWFPSAAAAYGEATFICPATHLLGAHAAQRRRQGTLNSSSSSTAWGYRYDVRDDELAAQGLGVPHLFESWAVWGPDSINGPGGAPASYYAYNAAVVPLVMDYWLSFVRTLDPSALKGPAGSDWEPWGEEADEGQRRRRLLVSSGNGNATTASMEEVPQAELDRCQFWRMLAPLTQQR
ncbi:Alpha/Beta hydrolase protein [Biscogniauxia sp. FL1348]|nr:Alpha/Beta hydrolase protein [Biscogniauxia sp. FL1348]